MTKLSLARILGGSRTLTLVEFWWEPHDRGTCTRDGHALILQQREPGWGQARTFRVSFSEELPRTPTTTVFRWCAVMTQDSHSPKLWPPSGHRELNCNGPRGTIKSHPNQTCSFPVCCLGRYCFLRFFINDSKLFVYLLERSVVSAPLFSVMSIWVHQGCKAVVLKLWGETPLANLYLPRNLHYNS